MKVDLKRYPILGVIQQHVMEFKRVGAVDNFLSSGDFYKDIEKYDTTSKLFSPSVRIQLLSKTTIEHLITKDYLRNKLGKFLPDTLPSHGWLLYLGCTLGYNCWIEDGEVFAHWLVFKPGEDICCYSCIQMRPIEADASILHLYESESNEVFSGVTNIFTTLVIPFLKFAETEVKIINASTGHKVISRGEKYVTDVKHDIEIIDSSWFTELIRTEGFGVSGHFRLQPYGLGNQLRRLQWINPFEKHGYHKLAKKDL
jgi:hypothetical protein